MITAQQVRELDEWDVRDQHSLTIDGRPITTADIHALTSDHPDLRDEAGRLTESGAALVAQDLSERS